jgi:hypothetical protein
MKYLAYEFVNAILLLIRENDLVSGKIINVYKNKFFSFLNHEKCRHSDDPN